MNNSSSDSTYSRKMLKMAEILKTIAHPVRLDMLKLLGQNNSMNVSEIQIKLECECEQSMLSHHLNKMKDKGILESFKDGKFMRYSLADKNITNLFECIEKFDLL